MKKSVWIYIQNQFLRFHDWLKLPGKVFRTNATSFDQILEDVSWYQYNYPMPGPYMLAVQSSFFAI